MKFRKPFVLYGSPELCRCDRERPRLVGEDDVARHHEVECPSPHTEPCTIAITGAGNRFTARRSFSSGSLYGSGSRSATGSSSTAWPDKTTPRSALAGANHDGAHFRAGELVEVAKHLGDQIGAEGVALGVVVERERADAVLQLGLNERHEWPLQMMARARSRAASSVSLAPEVRWR